MKNGITRGSCIEFLETRYLLVDYGLDLSFGAAGVVKTPAPFLAQELADGNILAVSDAGITRMTGMGAIDATFGKSGFVKYPRSIGEIDHATISGRHLLVAGTGKDGNSLIVLEYNFDGNLVSKFGDAGTNQATVQPPDPGLGIENLKATRIYEPLCRRRNFPPLFGVFVHFKCSTGLRSSQIKS